jgi:hypothetical protein
LTLLLPVHFDVPLSIEVCSCVFEKTACTVVLLFRVTVQVLADPLHPPPIQLVKVKPGLLDSVSVTFVPDAKSAEQVLLGQLMPDGLDVTVPPLTMSVRSTGLTAVKLAVTVVFAVSVRVHVLLVPLHPPLQLENV